MLNNASGNCAVSVPLTLGLLHTGAFSCGALRSVTIRQDEISIIWYTRVPTNPALPGPVRKCTFVNATIQISVSDNIPIKQSSASVPPYLTAHQLPPAAPMFYHPFPPPRLPVQTDSRRSRPSSEADAVLTMRWAGPRHQTRHTTIQKRLPTNQRCPL